MIIIFVLTMMSLLISQSFMDLMSFIVLCAMLRQWWLDRGNPLGFRFSKMGLEKLWIPWILVFVVGLALAPLKPEYASSAPDSLRWWWRFLAITELKWILNFYFFYWFFLWLKPAPILSTASSLSTNLGHARTALWAALLLLSAYAVFGWVFDLDFIKGVPLSDHGRAGGIFDDPMTFAHSYSLFFILGFLLGLDRVFSYFENSKSPFTKTDILLIAATMRLSSR